MTRQKVYMLQINDKNQLEICMYSLDSESEDQERIEFIALRNVLLDRYQPVITKEPTPRVSMVSMRESERQPQPMNDDEHKEITSDHVTREEMWIEDIRFSVATHGVGGVLARKMHESKNQTINRSHVEKDDLPFKESRVT